MSKYDPFSSEIYLSDYTDNRRVWCLSVSGGRVMRAASRFHAPSKPVGGVAANFALSRKPVVAGFFSHAMRQDIAVPDYGSSLSIIFGEKIVGDGFSTPSLCFYGSPFKKGVGIYANDGWREHIEYSAPWIREGIRKLNSGRTIDYQPVDFMDCLKDVIRTNRPEWLREIR